MDMKTIYRIFKSVGLALIALWMVSCQDLLTEDPKGQLAVTNFFNSKADLDLALNGMYSKVASDMYANIWAGFESVMGDDISTHPAANKQGLREVDTYNVSDNNTWVTECRTNSGGEPGRERCGHWTSLLLARLFLFLLCNGLGRGTYGCER